MWQGLKEPLEPKTLEWKPWSQKFYLIQNKRQWEPLKVLNTRMIWKKKSIFGRLIRQGCGRFGGGKKDNFEIFFMNMHPDMFKDS